MTQYVKFQLLGTTTGTSTTHLLDVDGQVGAAWTPHPDFTGALHYTSILSTNTGGTYLGTGQILYATVGDEEAMYVASGSAQQDFNIVVPILTQTDTNARRMGVAYRVQANKYKTFYLLRWGRSQISLSVVNNGTESVLTSAADSGMGVEKSLIVSVNGAIHRVYVNGVTLLATDTTITDPGQFGLWGEGGSSVENNRIYSDYSGTLPSQTDLDASAITSGVHDGAIEFDPFTLSATGTVGAGTTTGDGAIEFAALTLSATGNQTDGGAITFDPMVVEGTGNTGMLATIDAAVPVPTSQIEALVGIGGQGAITFGNLKLFAEGGRQGGAIIFEPMELAAEGVVGLVGSIDAAVPVPSAQISASMSITGAGAMTFAPLVVEGVGESQRQSALAATLPAVTGQITATVGIVGNGAITFDPMVLEGTLVLPLTATLSATIPRLYGTLFADLGATASWKVLSVNVQNGAVTEYENYQFNSLAHFNGKYLGAGDAGLFLLEGDDDAGTDIASYATFPLTESGSLMQKRPTDAYAHYRSPESMLLTATAKGVSFDYELPANDSDDLGEVEMHKAPLGKGLKSVRHQFGIQNREGADFEFGKLDLLLTETGRRAR
jgi:hypothetical protein